MVPRYRIADLTDWTVALLGRLGTPAPIARVVARHLVAADAAGHSSHGLAMLPTYLEAMTAGRLRVDGRPRIVADRPAHLTVDGSHGFGHYALQWTLERALERVVVHGVCGAHLVGCGHVGRLGEYALIAARRRAASVLSVGTVADEDDALVTPPGGRTPLLGTNPIAFGCPGDPPVVLDMATSMMAYYKLAKIAADDGELPPGVLVDAAGDPTTRADQIHHGGSILPFGGSKGYGLSMMVGLLSGLAGAAWDGTVGGAFVLVIGGSVIGTASVRIQEAVDRVRSAPRAEGAPPAWVPGERSRARHATSMATGVAVDPDVFAEIFRRCSDRTAPPPLPVQHNGRQSTRRRVP